MTTRFLDLPTYKIEDRREILERVLQALLADPDCFYPVRGALKSLTPDEIANWEARESIMTLKRTFKVASDVPPIAEIEPAHDEPVDQPTEQ